MPDVQGLLADPEFQALPEERKRVLLESIGTPPPQAAPARPPMSEADIASYIQSPEFQRAKEAGELHGTAEAAGPIMQTLGATALGGVAVGSGAISGALRAAGSPLGQAAIQGGYEAMQGGGPLSTAAAAVQGYLTGMGLKAAAASSLIKSLPLPKSLRAVLKHALDRGAKIAEESAPVAKKAAEGAVRQTAKVVQIRAEIAKPSVDDVAKRVMDLHAAKLSRGQIAEQLRSEFAPGQRGIGVGYFRKFADQLLDNLEKVK